MPGTSADREACITATMRDRRGGLSAGAGVRLAYQGEAGLVELRGEPSAVCSHFVCQFSKITTRSATARSVTGLKPAGPGGRSCLAMFAGADGADVVGARNRPPPFPFFCDFEGELPRPCAGAAWNTPGVEHGTRSLDRRAIDRRIRGADWDPRQANGRRAGAGGPARDSPRKIVPRLAGIRRGARGGQRLLTANWRMGDGAMFG
jgi:hypothetical protein